MSRRGGGGDVNNFMTTWFSDGGMETGMMSPSWNKILRALPRFVRKQDGERHEKEDGAQLRLQECWPPFIRFPTPTRPSKPAPGITLWPGLIAAASSTKSPVPNSATPAMEEGTAAAACGPILPPDTIVSSRRGQKRGAPDEDAAAAGDGVPRGLPRRAGAAAVEEEDDEFTDSTDEKEELDESKSEDDAPAPPAHQLFDFMHVHPDTADDATAGSSSSTAAGRDDQRPIDVTLRLGVGPLAAVDTTLSLSLGSPAALAQDAAASSDAKLNLYDAIDELARHAATDDPSRVPLSPLVMPEDEGFFFFTADGGGNVDVSTAATAEDGGFVEFAADDEAGGEPSGLDLNEKPSPSHGPDLRAQPVEKRHLSRAPPFLDFCSFLPS
ncbi:hypothetical protein HU200_050514 [Digitaria exilis]|uniref:Uncharacterized protein n=1 Tax=Digitaria exilis TaxID=1010633 RepID=A0A835E8V3_9POAL|nr:hypothetical protein HU200_050514 [Digitaria exilis]